MTTMAALSAGTVMVNGPEGDDRARPDRDQTNWYDIDWDRVEDDVRRLRQRIFAASRDGDHKKVRNLQKLMLRSRSNALTSVRRVTEINAGRKTAGVDGKVALLAAHKAELANWVQHGASSWTALPVKRVFIPKIFMVGVAGRPWVDETGGASSVDVVVAWNGRVRPQD
jgi:RNA-directed DNA polymerase